ncbi:MAG: UDP-N-acetylmuramoyl-tripeptide--D-alanyl-D-alanine ligase [Rubrivivax sp.]
MMTLAKALAMLPGAQLVGDGRMPFTRVHSDSRSLRAGDLFVALRGDSFDGHAFLSQARQVGAVAALAEHGLAEAGLPGLQVADALQSLQTLSAAWRRRFALPLIAVAGSNGKTTVTQMIASILRAALGEHAFATEGNFNNHIGVPLTLLRLRDDAQAQHRAGVLELGMNHPGEIALLAQLAAPTVALVNNAQREHQEFMATVEAAARENGAVIEALPADGVAVFPADAEFTPLWRQLAGARRVITFALQGQSRAQTQAQVQGSAAWQGSRWAVRMQTPVGEAAFELHVPGLHNVGNALAAAAAALAIDMPLPAIAQGLQAFEAVTGRSRLHQHRWHGAPLTLVDDAYNANPDSVRAAIDVLAALDGPRWLLLGDMGEVGAQGPAYHAEVGAYAHQRGIERLWTVGALCVHAAAAYGPGARHFDSVDALLAALADAEPAGAALVKGSKFMHMPRVVHALLKCTQEPRDAA